MISTTENIAGKPSTRIKKTKPLPIDDLGHAETIVAAVAQLANAQRIITARMDKEILAIKEKHAGKLAEIQATIDLETERLESWAAANPQFFAKKKSLAFPAGTIGYRTGTPKLALLNRQWTWDKCLEAVQKLLPQFIRTKPEINKEGILAYAARQGAAMGTGTLPECGLRVTQTETFFVEPQLTEVAS